MSSNKILTLDTRSLAKFYYETNELIDFYLIGTCKKIYIKTKGNIYIQTTIPGSEIYGKFVCKKLFIDDFEIQN